MEEIITPSYFIARKELLNSTRTIGSFQMENREKMLEFRGRVCGMTALSGVCVFVSFQGTIGCCILRWSHNVQTDDRWRGTGIPARRGNGSGVHSRERAETFVQGWHPAWMLKDTLARKEDASVARSAGRRRAAGLASRMIASFFLTYTAPPVHHPVTPRLRPAAGNWNILSSLYSGLQEKKEREEIPEVYQPLSLLGGILSGA